MTELREQLNNIIEEKNSKIIPENLKAGVEAFGVQGNFTSDADATAADIAKDKVAYVNGKKVIGELENNNNCTLDFTGLTSLNYSSIPLQITEINNLDVSSMTSLYQTFYKMVGLKKISLLNTSNVTNMSEMVSTCKSLREINLFDTSNVTNMNNMMRETKIKTIPQFDTSKNTSFGTFVYGCSELENFPILDTSNVTYMSSMVKNCPKLTDESLNNIMQMCINAVKFTGTKTMVYVGLSQEQATICQGLSNYQAFLDAGWTTGY